MTKDTDRQATTGRDTAFVFLSEVWPDMRTTDMSTNTRYFLQNPFHFFLVLAVIASTLFSWLNVNSYLIILLLACRLFDGSPRAAVRAVSRNVFFWAYTVIFLIELAGLLYTHHLFTAWKHMESKATLVAIPFIFLAGPFADPNGYRRLLTAYCWLMGGIGLYCLSMAVVEYRWQHDIRVFFYHDLTSAVGVNAVFFSGYVLVAILFLLFTATDRRVRLVLVPFFVIFMLLLSSRLMLVILLVVFIVYAIRRPWSLALLIALCVTTLAFTNNPFSRRYHELSPGISLRMFMWRSAFDILESHHAWAFGVTGGDSQALLDQKRSSPSVWSCCFAPPSRRWKCNTGCFFSLFFLYCIFALTNVDPKLLPKAESSKYTNEPPVGFVYSNKPNTLMMCKSFFAIFCCTLILTSCKKDNPVSSPTSNPTSYELASISYSSTYGGQSFYFTYNSAHLLTDFKRIQWGQGGYNITDSGNVPDPSWADTGYYHLQYSNGRVTRRHANDGPAPSCLAYTYNSRGWLTTVTPCDLSSNPAFTVYVYNDSGRATDMLEYGNGSTPDFHSVYSYDSKGNLEKEVDSTLYTDPIWVLVTDYTSYDNGINIAKTLNGYPLLVPTNNVFGFSSSISPHNVTGTSNYGSIQPGDPFGLLAMDSMTYRYNDAMLPVQQQGWSLTGGAPLITTYTYIKY